MSRLSRRNVSVCSAPYGLRLDVRLCCPCAYRLYLRFCHSDIAPALRSSASAPRGKCRRNRRTIGSTTDESAMRPDLETPGIGAASSWFEHSGRDSRLPSVGLRPIEESLHGCSLRRRASTARQHRREGGIRHSFDSVGLQPG